MCPSDTDAVFLRDMSRDMRAKGRIPPIAPGLQAQRSCSTVRDHPWSRPGILDPDLRPPSHTNIQTHHIQQGTNSRYIDPDKLTHRRQAQAQRQMHKVTAINSLRAFFRAEARLGEAVWSTFPPVGSQWFQAGGGGGGAPSGPFKISLAWLGGVGWGTRPCLPRT